MKLWGINVARVWYVSTRYIRTYLLATKRVTIEVSNLLHMYVRVSIYMVGRPATDPTFASLPYVRVAWCNQASMQKAAKGGGPGRETLNGLSS